MVGSCIAEYFLALNDFYNLQKLCYDIYGQEYIENLRSKISSNDDEWAYLTNYGKVPTDYYSDYAKMETKDSFLYSNYYDWYCHEKMKEKIRALKKLNRLYEDYVIEALNEHAPEKMKEACIKKAHKQKERYTAIVVFRHIFNNNLLLL
jgi:hypothetical protein